IPRRSASRALTSFPLRRISSARDRPTIFESLAVPPWLGIQPRSTSGCEKTALSAAMRRSQARASSAPAPRAAPAIAAMVGFVRCSRAQNASWPRLISSWAAFGESRDHSSMSSPAQKLACPAPVRTAARTESSFSKSATRAASSATIERLKRFRGGFSINRTTTAPSRVMRSRGASGIGPRWAPATDNRFARCAAPPGFSLWRRYLSTMQGEATIDRPWLASWPAGVPKSIDYPDISVDELLRRAAKKYANRPAISFYGKSISYGEPDAAADRFAAGLRRIGVRRGDRVSLVLPNTPHFIVAFFGVLRAGGIVVQTNPLYTARELEQLWTDAGVQTVIALDLFWHNVSKAKTNAGVKRVVVCDVGEFLKTPLRQLYPIKKKRDLRKQGHWPLVIPDEEGVHRFGDLVRTPGGPAAEKPEGADEVAVLQYTGGTTGTSKGAMLTHRNLRSEEHTSELQSRENLV